MPGREYLAIPGPSVVPDQVLQAMHRAAPNIYEGALVDSAPAIAADLKRVALTGGEVAMYIGNGHAAWEASLANVAGEGESVLVACTGRFGHGWAEMARGLGIETEIVDFGKRSPIDLDRVEEALAADTTHRLKALLAVHVDTSSSVRNDIKGLREVLDRVGHPALLMADCVASLGCDRFEMDAWGVDVMITGSQKGLMLPPGMCFVFFNDRAAKVRAGMKRVSRYWDWAPRAAPEQFYQYWHGTAPTHHLFGLRTSLDMILEEGMEAVWARHECLARAIWAACEVWAEGGALTMNIADPADRARSVTALRLDQGRAQQLRAWVEREMSLTLGIGLGMTEPGDPRAGDFFRIGHMGHVNGQMVLGALGSMEAGMRALGVPAGHGALEAAAKEIAGV
jgi:alanine-glyoxylate transaminase/serine-glyoxylate transaminase/serine-pyruvate transaminase